MENQKAIRWNQGELDVTLTVRVANVEDDFVRDVLIGEAAEEDAKLGAPRTSVEAARRFVKAVQYPSLISVTDAEGFSNWPLTYEEYRILPPQLAHVWRETAYALNPQWMTREPETPEEVAEAQKKATSSMPA